MVLISGLSAVYLLLTLRFNFSSVLVSFQSGFNSFCSASDLFFYLLMLSFGVAMITELQFLAFCQVFICLSVWTDFVGMIASETQSKYLHARHSGKNFEECLKNAMV